MMCSSVFLTNMTRCRPLLLLGTRCLSRCSFSSAATGATSGPSNSNRRPFVVLGIQQVAIGSESRSGLDQLWYQVLGLERPRSRVRLEKENVEEDIVSLGPHPFTVEIDLMTPIDPNKAPKVHVPPLNHIGLWVDPLEEAVKWMIEHGVRFTPGGIRKGAAGHDVAFIHPKGNDQSPIGGNGVLIELVQAPPDVVAGFSSLSSGKLNEDF